MFMRLGLSMSLPDQSKKEIVDEVVKEISQPNAISIISERIYPYIERMLRPKILTTLITNDSVIPKKIQASGFGAAVGDVLTSLSDGSSGWENSGFTVGDLCHSVASAKSGWLECNGDTISRSDYSNLFSVVGETFGAGDGLTTFVLPDYRGRALYGLGTHANVDSLADNDGVAVASRTPAHLHDDGTLVADSHLHDDGTLAAAAHTHSDGTLAVASHTHDDGTLAAASHAHSADGTLAVASHSHDDGTLVVDSHAHTDGTLAAASHAHADGTLAAASTTTAGTQVPTTAGATRPTLDHIHDITGNTASASADVTGSTGSATPGITGNTGSTAPDVTGNTASASADVTGVTGGTAPDVTGSTGSASPDVTGSTGSSSPSYGVARIFIKT